MKIGWISRRIKIKWVEFVTLRQRQINTSFVQLVFYLLVRSLSMFEQTDWGPSLLQPRHWISVLIYYHWSKILCISNFALSHCNIHFWTQPRHSIYYKLGCLDLIHMVLHKEHHLWIKINNFRSEIDRKETFFRTHLDHVQLELLLRWCRMLQTKQPQKWRII